MDRQEQDVTHRIRCYVDNCDYWGNGNRCEAKQIEVDNSSGSVAGRGDMEIGTLVGEREQGHRRARTSRETACETFAPRGLGNERNKMRSGEEQR
ncbi:MAG: DUF1540 domain-containing protein [Bacillota bacterium]|nr:DUF1540 domain-containing protein [Bacillota bacterium]